MSQEDPSIKKIAVGAQYNKNNTTKSKTCHPLLCFSRLLLNSKQTVFLKGDGLISVCVLLCFTTITNPVASLATTPPTANTVGQWFHSQRMVRQRAV